MDESTISDIAEVIPEVKMAQKSGYHFGLFEAGMWGFVFTAFAFVGGYFAGLAEKINVLCVK